MSKVGDGDIKDKSVVCPFYRWADKVRIGCEGVTDSNTLSLIFGDPNKRNEYKIKYCRSMERYRECQICQLLYRKYADEK